MVLFTELAHSQPYLELSGGDLKYMLKHCNKSNFWDYSCILIDDQEGDCRVCDMTELDGEDWKIYNEIEEIFELFSVKKFPRLIEPAHSQP